MTKAEAMRKAKRHAGDLIDTVAPGDIWGDEWDELSEEDQFRCGDALKMIADRLREQSRPR